jgi:hypothetical protein
MFGSAAATAATANAPCLASEGRLWRSRCSRMNGSHRPTSLARGARVIAWRSEVVLQHANSTCVLALRMQGLCCMNLPFHPPAATAMPDAVLRTYDRSANPPLLPSAWNISPAYALLCYAMLCHAMQCINWVVLRAHHPREHAGLIPGENPIG